MNRKKSIKEQIIAHLEGELNEQDLKDLLSWIDKSKENARFYAQVKDLWEASLLNASEIADTKAEWNRFVRRVSAKNKRNKEEKLITLKFSTIWKIAAVLVIGLLSGSIAYYLLSDKNPVYITSIAPKGAVSQIVLPDSTFIYLNAGTEIRYRVDKPAREVFLKGEAWFDVTKKQKQSFVVHTDYYDVTVLGTQFNVKAYSTDPKIVTTLEEGKVYISTGVGLKISRFVKLMPDEQFIYDKENKTLKVRKVKTKRYTAWKDNKLIFVNMNLKELFLTLERKYGVDIVVENDKLLKYHYDGTIKDETIIDVLELIGKTLPIKYEINDQKIIIKPKY